MLHFKLDVTRKPLPIYRLVEGVDLTTLQPSVGLRARGRQLSRSDQLAADLRTEHVLEVLPEFLTTLAEPLIELVLEHADFYLAQGPDDYDILVSLYGLVDAAGS